ncbi:hypothetical protein ACS5PN_15400 [Roseateles sp. NT4]|uniref:hypothetical protein n=1 Tax=Roseateles sp. NT4 TaxID=3453715 RepID=UPI003EEC1D4A
MRSRLALVALLGIALLAGCAAKPQKRVSMAEGALGASAGRIGVVMTALPKVDTQFPGAGCLLCLATASAMNSSLTDHVRTLPPEDVAGLKDRAAALIKAKGATPVVFPDALQVQSLPDFSGTDPNAAQKDFRGLRDKLNVDKLLLIQVDTIGVHRTYSAYVPTAEPKAVFEGKALLVDLKTNSLEWYHTYKFVKAADGPWDEPPKFPRLTNAYFQALELGKDEVLQPLQ